MPHTEVELILVNGRPAVFSDLVRGGDRVSVYPVFRAVDLGPIPRLRPPRPAAVRFVLDVHLGRLAAYLRLAGFDAVYRNHCPDETLAAMAHGEARILLTRDRELLKRRIVDWGYWVRETRPHRQLAEVIRRFGLGSLLRPFSRCGRCNAPLEQVPKAAVKDRVPPYVFKTQDQYVECPSCHRIYWKGTHWRAMNKKLEKLEQN